MKKAMTVETLKAMKDNAWGLYKSAERNGDEKQMLRNISRMNALQEAIWLLTDESYAKEIRAIFISEEATA